MGNTETGQASKDLAVVTPQNNQVATRSIFNMEPEEQITYAAKIATALKKVIDKQGLTSNIHGKAYIRAEGWQTLGTLLGITPRERSVLRLADGSYEAYIELVSTSTGHVVGGASAICSIKETRWSRAEEYARRSMSVTRATGKAYRTGFAWVVTLAGYEPTPEEEMPEEKRVQGTSQTKAPEVIKAQVIEAEVEVESDTYTGSTEQQKKIQEILEKNNIPENLWYSIHQEMEGKPGKFLLHVLKKYKAQPHVQ
jgi:hypothetical protein